MKISELILEQSVDEGLGSAIASGVGKVARGVGAVAGGAAGAWDAAKAGFQQGRAAVAGQYANQSQQPGTTSTSGQQGGGAAPATGVAGQQGSSVTPSATASSQQGATPTAGSTQAPAGNVTQQAAASSAAQPAQTSPAAASASSGAMKASDIVKGLDDTWQKATADQGSETTSPAVQNQIRAMAKQAGLTGQTISENKVGYQSKFLNMTI